MPNIVPMPIWRGPDLKLMDSRTENITSTKDTLAGD